MTVPGRDPDQKLLASMGESGTNYRDPRDFQEPHAEGERILAAPLKNPTSRNLALFGLALTALVVLVWGATLLPASHAPLRETGQGGPVEKPMETSVAHLGSLNPLRCMPDLPVEQMGPVFRPEGRPVEMRIGRGQTFYEALAARGVAHEDIMAVVKACSSFRKLTSVRAGEIFQVHATPDGGLRSLAFDLDLESYVTWVRDGDTYRRIDGTYPVERCLKGINGTIRNSLYASLQELDAPLALSAKMNDILGWDIDFSRDLRKGDTFRILYEEVWKDGELVRTDAIRALEIVNKGKTRRAYRYETTEGRPGYYDPDGKNLQKQLMRAPLNYSRISSSFSYRRFHPVLKKWMPHLGVDYAAPLGTPVRAAGNGVVVTAARKKGNGRYIQIRHTNREYETYYLHLSRYAKGIQKGTKVTQGQIIGYVGATGYATGPHLDFRVKRGGKFVDPRKLKLPAAAPVSDTEMDRFAALATMYDGALNELTGTVEPVLVLPIALVEAPEWNGGDYAVQSLPATVRAAH